jgi:hypothetical protein
MNIKENRLPSIHFFMLLQGSKCDLRLCKACCRTKCYLENRDCAGHRILIKTRREKAREQRKAESQSDIAGDHQTVKCEHVIGHKETHNNVRLDKTKWEHAVQAEQASALKQDRYCQLQKEQKVTNENYVTPILNVESAKNSTNISVTNLKEHQNDAESVNHAPQYETS